MNRKIKEIRFQLKSRSPSQASFYILPAAIAQKGRWHVATVQCTTCLPGVSWCAHAASLLPKRSPAVRGVSPWRSGLASRCPSCPQVKPHRRGRKSSTRLASIPLWRCRHLNQSRLACPPRFTEIVEGRSCLVAPGSDISAVGCDAVSEDIGFARLQGKHETGQNPYYRNIVSLLSSHPDAWRQPPAQDKTILSYC